MPFQRSLPVQNACPAARQGRSGARSGRPRRQRGLSSKTLRETALDLQGLRQRGLFGVEMKLDHRVTLRDLLYRERVVKDRERERGCGGTSGGTG